MKNILLVGLLLAPLAALSAAATDAGRSLANSVSPAKTSDIESEVRQRFDYWEKDYSYNPNDPAYTVVYAEAAKQAQRDAAKAMISALTAAAESTTGSHEFTIPAGIYRVEPGQIQIKKTSNFIIHASGVEMIVDSEKSGAAFSFTSCTNVTLTGRAQGDPSDSVKVDAKALIIDSEQLPMSVARILSVDTNAETLEVEILPGYATELPNDERMMAYDLKGRLLNIMQMGWKEVMPLDGRKFRLKTPSLRNPRNRNEILIPGMLLALHNSDHHRNRTHSVFNNTMCKDMTLESIRDYDGSGAPADHRTAGYTVFRDWRLYPRPGTSRLPITTGLGQLSKNGGTFLFENCSFGPHLDDGINLLSGMSIVGKNISETNFIITGGQQPTVGSTLAFYGYTNWINFGEAKVVASEKVEDAGILAAVNAFAKKNRTTENARNAYRTILDRPVKLEPYAMVVHSDYRADSIIVRGCLFRDQLAQIMLIQGARSGLIENNLLLRSTGAGVSCQFAQYWWEGPMPENMVIRNNVFRDNPVAAAVNGLGASAAVAIYPGTKYPTNARLMRHFHIEGNIIINPSIYGIVVRNAEDVVIRNNRIINPGACAVTGIFQGRPISEQYAAICLDAVSRAEVTDNEIVFGNPRCQRAILMETSCDTGTIRLERNHEFHGETGSTEK